MVEQWLHMDSRVSIMQELGHHNKALQPGNKEPSLFLKLLENIVSLPLHTWHLQKLMHSERFGFQNAFPQGDHLP
ncbi:hypothetical protein OIU79_017884 [Salix purpurea]|uniref:Uncharacterized protein n=1 Tax=Salix purpurea TaxID=77065 RepID=A0A9Q0WWN1_SALPP|nr:hypothetical protein OIU79_017884 [Salix purpurea]